MVQLMQQSARLGTPNYQKDRYQRLFSLAGCHFLPPVHTPGSLWSTSC